MTVRKPVDSTAAKGPHTLNHEPERKPSKQSPPKPVRYKKPIMGGSKGGNYSDGFCATSPSYNRTVYFDT